MKSKYLSIIIVNLEEQDKSTDNLTQETEAMNSLISPEKTPIEPQTNFSCSKCADAHPNNFYWPIHKIYICNKLEKEMFKEHRKCGIVNLVIAGAINKSGLFKSKHA